VQIDVSVRQHVRAEILIGAFVTLSFLNLAFGGAARFTPMAKARCSQTLLVTDSAGGKTRLSAYVEHSAGSGAAVSLSSSSLVFASQAVETTSAPDSITLTNAGKGTLSIGGVAFTGADPSDFVQATTCGASLAPGAHCTIAVLFAPTAAGARTAQLSITDSAPGSPQTVNLSGTGSHDVILSWTESASPGVAGYFVYRGTSAGGEAPTPLNSTPINGASFTDESVTAGATYYYVATAVASDGVTQSVASNEASATVPSH
jgi:hypothetical protein